MGRIGISATSMVLAIMSRNSSKPFFNCGDSKNEMPSPMTKAVTRALMTSNSGGISIVKNGWISSAVATAWAAWERSMSIGKMPVLVK